MRTSLVAERRAEEGEEGETTEANCRGTDLNARVATECYGLVAVEGGGGAGLAITAALWVGTCHRSGRLCVADESDVEERD